MGVIYCIMSLCSVCESMLCLNECIRFILLLMYMNMNKNIKNDDLMIK